MRVSEPLETKIAAALDAAGIEYLTDYEGKSPANLDFYLPDYDLYLEIKGGALRPDFRANGATSQCYRHPRSQIGCVRDVSFGEHLVLPRAG
jgi:hypothetical protein